MQKMPTLPVFDLHCDLLSYLRELPDADPAGQEDIGASLPYLQQGNVKLQVMAIYTDVEPGSTFRAQEQIMHYQHLLRDYNDYLQNISSAADLESVTSGNKIGTIVAIENAAGLCEPNEPVLRAVERLNDYVEKCGAIAYIGITHHTANRFGGGNMSDLGLTNDGKALLDNLDGRGIAVDLSHTSDALAEGIFEHLSKSNLNVPVIASHSNFRKVWNHARNLPDEFVQEIIARKGLIGMNFLRAYVNNNSPEALLDHIEYGIANGAEDCLAMGADFFYTKNHPDASRRPFYFTEHENAATYPAILQQLKQRGLKNKQLKKIAFENALHFFGNQLS